MKRCLAKWALILLGPPLLFAAVLFAIPFLGQFFVPKNVNEFRVFLVANRTWVDSIDGYRVSMRSHGGGIGVAEAGRLRRLVVERDGRFDTFEGTISPDYSFRLRDSSRFDASSFEAWIGSYWLLTSQDSAWLRDSSRLAVWRERTRILVDSFDVRELDGPPDRSMMVFRIGPDLLVKGVKEFKAKYGFLDGCEGSIYHNQIQLVDDWTVIRNVDCKE